MTERQRRREFAALSVLILVGGQGSRLKKEVSDRPKPMAEISGRPFLDLIMAHASTCGLRRFVLCTGYKSNFIRDYYAETDGLSRISISQEARPLGTAGAVKNAAHLIESDPFIVMNGDSLCLVDLYEFYKLHKERGAEVSMVATEMGQAGDYGTLAVSEASRIKGYQEKTGQSAYANAGIYCMEKKILTLIPAGAPCSLERDIFPSLAARHFYAFVTALGFIDIGTPERYREAKKRLSV